MRRLLRASLFVICLMCAAQAFRSPLLAAAPPAGAAEESGPSHELLFETINFILLAGLFVYLYRKHGRAFFNERSDSIRRSLEEGRQALERSQARLAEAEKKLAGLQDEVRALKERAEREIAEEQEKMRKAADDDARRIEEFAKARIVAATNAAKLELKDYIVDQALEQARGKIQQRMDEASRKKLVGFFLADLSSKPKSN